MAKKAKTPKKRNPNDATFRNINALKAKVKFAAARLDLLEERNIKFGNRIQRLEEVVRALAVESASGVDVSGL